MSFFKYITFDGHGHCEMDSRAYRKHINSISNNLTKGLIGLLNYIFHDEILGTAICHNDGNIELIDYDISFLLYSAQIIDAAFPQVTHGIYLINSSIEIEELLFSEKNKKYIWNILFGDIERYISILFSDVKFIRRNPKQYSSQFAKVKFNYYKNINRQEIVSPLFYDLDLDYQIRLLDEKRLFPYQIFTTFSECKFRLQPITRVIEFYDGDIEIVFANRTSIVFSSVKNFTIFASTPESNKLSPYLKIWNNNGELLLFEDYDGLNVTKFYKDKDNLLWLYEELTVTNNQTFALAIKTTMFSMIIEFKDFMMYDAILKSWFDKDGKKTNCPSETKSQQDNIRDDCIHL
jgi:hypothetical protein